MDWKVVLSTFGLIFVAELGDKTQLAAIAMAAKSRSPVAVFVGAVAALALVTLVGVALGEAVASFIPAALLQKVSGALFVVIGVAILLFG